MWIHLDVHREDSVHLALGQPVNSTAMPVPESFVARSPGSAPKWIPRPARSASVRKSIIRWSMMSQPHSTQRQLRAGSFGTAQIRIRQQPQVTVVPNEAVQWDATAPWSSCNPVPVHSKLARVRIGSTDDSFTEILDGVATGDKVATHGSHVLKSELLRTRQTASTN